MTFLSSTLLAVSSIATIAQAVPNVTPVVAKGGCSVYPGYDADTGIAGPWVITIDQCTNSTTPDEPCTNEGFGSNSQVRRLAGDTGIHQGYVSSIPHLLPASYIESQHLMKKDHNRPPQRPRQEPSPLQLRHRRHPRSLGPHRCQRLRLEPRPSRRHPILRTPNVGSRRGVQ